MDTKMIGNKIANARKEDKKVHILPLTDRSYREIPRRTVAAGEKDRIVLIPDYCCPTLYPKKNFSHFATDCIKYPS